MKTKTIEVCDAIVYSIACERNDSADIRCGGPAVLGYDFGVSPDVNEKEMIAFLKSCIRKYNRPFMGITTKVQKDFPIEHLWDKDRIEECIKTHTI